MPEQRILEQAARLPPAGAVTGWAACRWLGAAFFDGRGPDGVSSIPVGLACGAEQQIRRTPQTSISREPLPDDDVVLRFGLRCTRAQRALFDEMRRPADWRESVVAMDMIAAAELVSVSRMRSYVEAHRSWRRCRQVLRALDFASERSRSPNETRLRLIWRVDAGLPEPLANCEVFTRSGRLVGVADLFDPVAGVVGEFDGADHRLARRHSRDVAREEDFRRLGLEYFKVTGPDLPHRARVVERMHSTRARAQYLPEHERRWTLQPPPEWPPDWPLDEILDHRAWLAASEHAHGGR